MAGFGGIVALLVKTAVKSAVKFELAIDPIIAKFKSQCPPKSELDQILKQKNQISQAITQIQTSLTSLSDTGSTIDGIVTGMKVGVAIIKALPTPSSVPPGVGIPLNIINGFSDTLDTLGILLRGFGGVTSQIAPSLEIITKTLATVSNKLSILDGLLAGCLESETEGMTNLEKEEFFQSLGIDLSSLDTTGGSNNSNGGNPNDPNNSGNFNGGNPNDPNNGGNPNETLEDRLNPNSNNPIVYNGFTIIIDNDAGNQFSFPNRRAVGTNGEGVRIVTPFTYSSSTQVLIDTIKFQINQYISTELSRLASEAKREQLRIAAQQSRYNTLKIKSDKLYNSYIRELKIISTSKIPFPNFKILTQKYNIALAMYKTLLSQSFEDKAKEYALNRIQELEKLQKQTLKDNRITQITKKINPTKPSLSSSSPPPSYSPFNGPGQSGEVRFSSGQAYRYSNSVQPPRWGVFTPNLSPINRVGEFNNEEKIIKNISRGIITKHTYKWDLLRYRWILIGTQTFD